MKRVWIVRNKENGFEYIILVKGTEDEVVDYIRSELKSAFTYCGATEDEVKMATMLGIKIYLA